MPATKSKTKSSVSMVKDTYPDFLDVTKQALLVSMHFRHWTASKKDPKSAAEVAHAHNSKVEMHTHTRKILRPGFLNGIINAGAAARTVLYKYTVPWTNEGLRMIRNEGLMPFLNELSLTEERLQREVQKAAGEYVECLREAPTLCGDLYNPDDYPPVEEFIKRFSIEVDLLPMPDTKHFRADLINAELLQDEHEKWVAATKNASNDIYKRLSKVLTEMVEKLHAYKVEVDDQGKEQVVRFFRNSVVTNVTDLLNLVPLLNINDDPQIVAFHDEIQRELCRLSADDLRQSETARMDTADKAEEIIRKMSAYMAR